MIGAVITGHGNFAPGMMEALTMIAGTQEKFEVVAFEEGASLEGYEASLEEAIENTLKDTDGVIIFSDLLGGTPFRTAMIAASNFDKVEVLTGTNLPMLIELGMLRSFETDVVALASRGVEIGKEGVQHTRLPQIQEDNLENEDAEGI